MTQTKPTPATTQPIGKWKPYPAYKDSGIEWLGEIPEHWEAKKIKRLCLVKRGASPRPIDDPVYFDDEGQYAWVRISDVTASNKYLLKTEQKLSLFGQSKSICLEPGELFLSIAGTVGKPIITKIKCCIHDGFVYFENLRQNRKYLFYVFSSGQLYKGLGKLGTQLNLNTDTIGDIRIPIPSLPEQQAIAAFLDRETTKINTLISEKERLIELLQEKRAALISQAVTKGLDADVAMKDSGIEWLGEIPAHWGVKRLKFCLCSIEQGWSPSCENRPAEAEEWGVLKVGCVNGVKFNPDENKALPPELVPLYDLEIKPGDVLISRANTRELLGSTSIVPEVRPGLLLCDKLYRLRLLSEVLDATYFVLAMGSSTIRFQLERDATGASNSMQNISQATILNLVFPLPDVAEQQAITAYLDQETAKIDTLISRIREAIEKLREYSTALVSAAVTGKIDVRENVTGA